ncbi:hypothetical protein LCGC14_0164050 [marine sediment metagenome]|uniref:Uncharacterized protein n=1 Tax=marine sediment metagenome TaxID=412755 RepID=A0A0F9XCR0_9ZZZZ
MASEVSNETMIEESLEVASDALNDWEYKFLISIKERVDQGRELTDNQQDKLDQIYKKVCDSPY